MRTLIGFMFKGKEDGFKIRYFCVKNEIVFAN